jgi:hypothetical protein
MCMSLIVLVSLSSMKDLYLALLMYMEYELYLYYHIDKPPRLKQTPLITFIVIVSFLQWDTKAPLTSL